jgi:hypothetical protein
MGRTAPRILSLALLLALACAATAYALGTGANVSGRGRLVYTATAEATVFASEVRAGARIVVSKTGTITPTCVVVKRRPCFRVERRTGAIIALRPIRFLVDGTAYRLAITSSAPFVIGLSGTGKVLLVGKGSYTVDGATHTYRGTRTVVLGA